MQRGQGGTTLARTARAQTIVRGHGRAVTLAFAALNPEP